MAAGKPDATAVPDTSILKCDVTLCTCHGVGADSLMPACPGAYLFTLSHYGTGAKSLMPACPGAYY
jgi:hypothetical protein